MSMPVIKFEKPGSKVLRPEKGLEMRERQSSKAIKKSTSCTWQIKINVILSEDGRCDTQQTGNKEITFCSWNHKKKTTVTKRFQRVSEHATEVASSNFLYVLLFNFITFVIMLLFLIPTKVET